MSDTDTAQPTETAAVPVTGTLRPAGAPFAPSRAARELGLKRREFELAVHLGCVRTVPDEGGGGGRVSRDEIDRLRNDQRFPETLRERVRAVGTGDGAELMDVTPARFTRLARLGLVTPVTFYLNRYRVVVWLYLADELRQFAAGKDTAPLLTGRTSPGTRDRLEAGLDLRPRNWRGRTGIPAPTGRRPVGAGRDRGILPRPRPGRGNRQRPVRTRPLEPLPAGPADPWRAGIAHGAARRADHDGGRPGRDRLAARRPDLHPGRSPGPPSGTTPQVGTGPAAPRHDASARFGAPGVRRVRTGKRPVRATAHPARGTRASTWSAGPPARQKPAPRTRPQAPRASLNRTRSRQSSFRNSPSWTTETSSLPSTS